MIHLTVMIQYNKSVFLLTPRPLSVAFPGIRDLAERLDLKD